MTSRWAIPHYVASHFVVLQRVGSCTSTHSPCLTEGNVSNSVHPNDRNGRERNTTFLASDFGNALEPTVDGHNNIMEENINSVDERTSQHVTPQESNDEKTLKDFDGGASLHDNVERDDRHSRGHLGISESVQNNLDHKPISVDRECGNTDSDNGSKENERKGDKCGEKDTKKNEHKENSDDEDDTEGLPIDRGWAWFVLAGCFLNTLVFVGYVKSLSILFVEYLRLFEAPASATTLIMGVTAGMYSLSAPFTMHFVLERLGVRKTALLGGTVCTVAMVTGVFAPNITFLICVHCVLTGSGHSMLFGPGLFLLGQYFKKRRGMAMAISMSAISLASGVFPMITRLLLDEYGIRGTMLIFTGITMNMFVAGSLFRPIEFYKRRRKTADVMTSFVGVKVNNQITERLSPNGNSEQTTIRNIESKKIPTIEWINSEPNGESLLSSSLPCYKDNYLSLDQFPSPRLRTYSECSRRSQIQQISESEKMLYANSPDVLSVSILDLTKTDNAEENHTPVKHHRNKNCSCKILDVSLFKKPMFQLLTFCSSFGILISLVPNYLPALANEKRITKTDAALLLLIMGTLDFFSRLGIGALVDLKFVKVNKVIAVGLICSGTMVQFTSFYNTFPLMMMFAVINGFVGSAYHCMMPVLIVDFMGLDYMAKALGFVTMFHGMSVAITHPIIGGIKDLSGSFTYGYSYIGIAAYITATLLLFGKPLCRRRATAEEELKDVQDEAKKPLKEH